MRRSHFTIPFGGIFLCLTLLTGCSQKFQDVNDTAKLALFGDDDTQLSAQAINQLPYASMYARIGDGPQAFMVLAFAEQDIVVKLTNLCQSTQCPTIKMAISRSRLNCHSSWTHY